MNLREKATEARRFFSKSAWSGARTLAAALFAVAAAGFVRDRDRGRGDGFAAVVGAGEFARGEYFGL